MPDEALAFIARYTFISATGDRVLCWDNARFVNHSCLANCLSPGSIDIEIAVRDIAAGEELTDDYGSLNLPGQFRCACKARGCRGAVSARDFELLNGHWDQLLRDAMPRVLEVEQPLWDLVPNAELLGLAALYPSRMPSIKSHAYPALPH